MISESQQCRESALSGRLAFLDGGIEPARMRVFGGERPASAALAATGEMLCEIALTRPAGTVSGGALSLNQAEEGLIVRTGVATWVRVVNGDGQTAFDLDASAQDGPGEAKFTSVQLYAGGGLRLLSAILG